MGRVETEMLESELPPAQPRAQGAMVLSVKPGPRATSAIARLRTSGATKLAFPGRPGPVEAIVINTSGGLTGGDRFMAEAEAQPGSRLTLTTQAAERAYLSRSGAARVSTRLRVGEGAAIHWLPQELILFDGANLERSLEVTLAEGAEFLMVEPVIFGRAAMGETCRDARFLDRVRVTRDARPVYTDAVRLSGAVDDLLHRPAVAGAARAMAAALLVAPRAEALLPRVRDLLPATGGASLLAPDILALRLVAPDGFELRRSLVPVLECLAAAPLPKSWSL